jgi:hypothetical protein
MCFTPQATSLDDAMYQFDLSTIKCIQCRSELQFRARYVSSTQDPFIIMLKALVLHSSSVHNRHLSHDVGLLAVPRSHREQTKPCIEATTHNWREPVLSGPRVWPPSVSARTRSLGYEARRRRTLFPTSVDIDTDRTVKSV